MGRRVEILIQIVVGVPMVSILLGFSGVVLCQLFSVSMSQLLDLVYASVVASILGPVIIIAGAFVCWWMLMSVVRVLRIL
jgi:hypothetical protein